MNPHLQRLHAYPFERLNTLLEGVTAPPDRAVISMSIGEPRHPAPAFVVERLREAAGDLTRYPTSAGLPELREAVAGWLVRRFGLAADAVDPQRHVLPVSGTREALFAFAQAVVDPMDTAALVAMPNPFYQIYEGAALLAGATPRYLDLRPQHGYLPDLDAVSAREWARCRLLYLCTPGNPTGAVHDLGLLCHAIELAHRYGFIVASDECYSELYLDEAAPPPGLLQACARLGLTGFERCVVFHSLSKRSNLPGLRSGFVAGDAAVLDAFRRYRTYHGCAAPIPTQLASAVAWRDEGHVVENRRLYREKFTLAREVLGDVWPVPIPAAGFYLWATVPGGEPGGDAPPGDDERFARAAYAEAGVILLPGRYLARGEGATNPGAGRVRISLVPEVAQCREALQRLRALAASHQ